MKVPYLLQQKSTSTGTVLDLPPVPVLQYRPIPGVGVDSASALTAGVGIVSVSALEKNLVSVSALEKNLVSVSQGSTGTKKVRDGDRD